jgi:hypothetical protein
VESVCHAAPLCSASHGGGRRAGEIRRAFESAAVRRYGMDDGGRIRQPAGRTAGGG